MAQQIERRLREDARVLTFIDAFDIAKGDDFEDRISVEMKTVDELVVDIDRGGGATFLKAKNVVAMNEMETYLSRSKRRASAPKGRTR